MSIFHSKNVVFQNARLDVIFFLGIYFSEKVEGKCDNTNGGIADTDWAACLVAEADGSCPHGFPKLDDDSRCTPYGSRTPPWKERVCCLLTPAFDLKVGPYSWVTWGPIVRP